MQKFKRILPLFLGAIIFLFYAFLNGFPVVYSDTSTYLASGFELKAPFDRPIMYGLFLRFSSLNGLSLWLTIFAQGFLLSFLLFKLLQAVFPNYKNINALFIVITIFTVLFTSVSWVASQLIADVFTPILILSFILLVATEQSKKTKIILYVIFFLATATHTSHIAFNVLLIFSVLILKWLKFLDVKKNIQIKPLLVCLGIVLLSIATMGSAISKSKHVFLMGALVEHGIVKQYLDEHCENNNYKFCEFKDELPEKAWQFIWEDYSPFYKMGSWKGTKEEFNTIIFNTLTTPKYIWLHIKASVKATIEQLTMFKMGDGNGAFLQETLLYQRINTFFPHEINSYISSKQNKKQLGFLSGFNLLSIYTLIASVGLFLFALIKSCKSHKKLLLILLIVFFAVLINAWTCGTLANAIDRLGAKVMWLIPLFSVIGIIKLKQNN